MILAKTPPHHLTRNILIALLLGILFGLVLHFLPSVNPNLTHPIETYLTNGALSLLGQLFLRLLSMLVVPIVFVSLATGVASLPQLSTLSRIGIRTLTFYLLTTALAISIALLLATLLSPGKNFHSPPPTPESSPHPPTAPQSSPTTFIPPTPPSLLDTFLSLVPRNILAAFSQDQMLAVITVSLLFGAALNLAGPHTANLRTLLLELNTVLLSLVGFLLYLAPIGVFALLARTFASQGWASFLPLLLYFLTVLLALLVHMFLIYPLLLRLLTHLSPLQFFQKFRNVLAFAFATSSSNATLPVTLNTVETKLGVSNQVAAFTLPLGATLNMDGTSIMQGVATVFLAQVYSIPLTLNDFLLILLTATLASIGTAGIPGVGLILLTLVLQQVGIPTEGIALILGIDRLLDMARTAVNVTGDAIAALYVAKAENQLDLTRFLSPD